MRFAFVFLSSSFSFSFSPGGGGDSMRSHACARHRQRMALVVSVQILFQKKSPPPFSQCHSPPFFFLLLLFVLSSLIALLNLPHFPPAPMTEPGRFLYSLCLTFSSFLLSLFSPPPSSLSLSLRVYTRMCTRFQRKGSCPAILVGPNHRGSRRGAK